MIQRCPSARKVGQPLSLRRQMPKIIGFQSCTVKNRIGHSQKIIMPKLGQSDRYLDHYSHTKDDWVRGHYGVTGVIKVLSTKKASSPSEYVALSPAYEYV